MGKRFLNKRLELLKINIGKKSSEEIRWYFFGVFKNFK